MRNFVYKTVIVTFIVMISGFSAFAASDRQNKKNDADVSLGKEAKENPDNSRDAQLEEKIELISNRDIDIPWFTMSPTVGYGFFMHSNLKPGININNRHAVIVRYSFNLGGRGFCSEISPVYQYERASNGFEEFHAVGLYLGINWRWRWWNFVPSGGFGVKTNVLLGENIDYGIEIYGRFPLSLTWYLTSKFNLIFEFAPAFGVVGVKSDEMMLKDLHLGHGFAIDFSIGTRFP